MTTGQDMPFWTSHKTCLPTHRDDRHDVHLSRHDMLSSTTVNLGFIMVGVAYGHLSQGQTPAGI